MWEREAERCEGEREMGVLLDDEEEIVRRERERERERERWGLGVLLDDDEKEMGRSERRESLRFPRVIIIFFFFFDMST